MRINREVSINLLLLAGLLVFAGWHFREDIRARLVPQRPVPVTTVLYTWKDSRGTVHFSEGGEGHRDRAIVVRTDRITPVEPLADETRNQSPPAYSLASGANLHASGKSGAQEAADMRANMEAQATNDN